MRHATVQIRLMRLAAIRIVTPSGDGGHGGHGLGVQSMRSGRMEGGQSVTWAVYVGFRPPSPHRVSVS